MKSAIVFVSETGFTRRYAEWISEDTGLEALELRQALGEKDGFDLLVIGSPVYGGEISDRRRIRKLIRNNPRAICLCFVCGLSPAGQETIRRIQRENFRDSIAPPLHCFPGGLDMEKLRPSRRTELFLYRMMMKRGGSRTETIRHFLNVTERSCDLTDRRFILPLVERIQRLSGQIQGGVV